MCESYKVEGGRGRESESGCLSVCVRACVKIFSPEAPNPTYINL